MPGSYLSAFNQIDGPDSVVVVPGAHYQSGGLHRLLFGSHWRHFWTLPVKVPVLDLDGYAGGLVPLKKGGGQQTKSLKFTGADGRIYKFRSVDKDPSKVLPDALQRTLVADVLRDQVSSANPLAPLVAVPLLRAIGVLQAEPTLVMMPDTPGLGEFREEYGGLLGMIEIHPDEYDDTTAPFGGSEKITGTYKMFGKLNKHADHQPDAREYLKARAIDLLLGDWDRHYDQWRWAAFERNDTTYWQPIPRDRDQVFAKFNGILPWAASKLVPQLNHFSDEYEDIVDYTWSGRYLDRRILPRLEWHTWDSVAAFVAGRIADTVIRAGIRRLPPEHQALGGEELFHALQSRRNGLHKYMREYYLLLADEVDIYGTNDKDRATVERLNDESVRISLYDIEAKHRVPYFQRVFFTRETSDIRIYLGDDDDSVTVTGNVETSITVRVVGGDGADTFVDRGNVDGSFLDVLFFIPNAETKTYFYDSGKKSTFVSSTGTCIDDTKVPEPQTDAERYETPRDWGYSSLNVPYLSYSSDLGILLKLNHYRRLYGFRNDEFKTSYRAGLGYAPMTARFYVDLGGEFRKTFLGAPILFHTSFSSMDVQHFYGFGNETTRDEALEDDDYYDVSQVQWNLYAAVRIVHSSHVTADIGAGYKRVQHWENIHHLADILQPYGIGRYDMVYGEVHLEIDHRDNIQYPMSGSYLIADARYAPEFLDVNEHFGIAGIEGRTYMTANLLTPITLALRARAEQVFYDTRYPYFMASFLGGKYTLRGFRTQRFSGDGSVLGAAEVRIPVGTIRIVVPILVGVSGFAESGQILMRGIESDVWHTGYGGGVWATFAEPKATFSLSVGRSNERLGFYASIGFPW